MAARAVRLQYGMQGGRECGDRGGAARSGGRGRRRRTRGRREQGRPALDLSLDLGSERGIDPAMAALDFYDEAGGRGSRERYEHLGNQDVVRGIEVGAPEKRNLERAV